MAILHLHTYHPWHGGNNSSFDAVSGHILDLKDASCGGHANACTRFANDLCGVLQSGHLIPNPAQTIGVVVPSSAAGQYSAGLERVLQGVARRGLLASVEATALTRTKPISKLAHGGDRSINVHLQSIVVNKQVNVAGKRVILLDDVTTSGNSLLACETLGAALTNRRALGPAEGGMIAKTAIIVLALSIVGVAWPQVIAWPVALVGAWIGFAWLGRAWALKRKSLHTEAAHVDEADALHEAADAWAASSVASREGTQNDPSQGAGTPRARDEAGVGRG